MGVLLILDCRNLKCGKCNQYISSLNEDCVDYPTRYILTLLHCIASEENIEDSLNGCRDESISN